VSRSPAALDRRLLLFARTRGHTPRAEAAVARFSSLGEHAAVWLALGAGGALLDASRRERWLGGARAVAGAYVLNTAIKFVVRRPRPELPGLPALTATPTGLSLPSAHATTAFAAVRAYRGLVPAAALLPLAGALAVSRLYLGVHYPSDILAGALLGTACGEVAACR
jgi:membrane-associated phospholipid phosphatase